MDRLAYQAQKHWEKYLPAAYALIDNREDFFEQLADEAQGQIEDLEEHLRGPDVPDEPFVARMARYRSARHRAEETVISEVLFPPAECS